MMIKSKKSGFTLLEIMVVVGMIAILAGIFIPKVTGYIQEVKKVKVIEQARKVVLAVEAVNIKSSNAIKKDSKISSIFTITGDLLKKDDVDKLKAESTSVEDCYNIVDTEKNTFTIDADGILEKVGRLGTGS